MRLMMTTMTMMMVMMTIMYMMKITILIFSRHDAGNRELKQLRRRPQRQLQKSNRFNDQNNSSARASRFLLHLFDVHYTTMKWNLLIWRFKEDYIRRRNFLHLFNLNKILENSTPGKFACIWHIERVQIEAIKFEGTQIHFFGDVFKQSKPT